jgi:cell wall-associated NlpC family hydrolase
MHILCKHIILIICILAFSRSSWGQTDSNLSINQTFTDTVSVTLKPKTIHSDSLINYAFSFSGKKYRRGGTTVNGFDCSGYSMMVYKKFGVKLPHSSAAQSLVGIEIPKNQIKKGDLIFFRGRNSKRGGVGHVGIVISEKGEPVKFIHSSSSDGVRIDALESPYYKKRYVKTTRVAPLK